MTDGTTFISADEIQIEEGEASWRSRGAYRSDLLGRLERALEQAKSHVTGGDHDGIDVVTMGRIGALLRQLGYEPIPAPDSHNAEVVTGATITVHAVCPACKVSDVITMAVDAVLEQDATSSEIKLKAKSKKKGHSCGQLTIAHVGPLVPEGQTEAFPDACGEPVVPDDALDPDDDDLVEAPRCTLARGHEGDHFALTVETGTVTSWEGEQAATTPPAPAINLDPLPWATDDDDLLPGETVAPAAPAFDLGACPFPKCVLAAEHTGDHSIPGTDDDAPDQSAYPCDLVDCLEHGHGHTAPAFTRPVTAKSSRKGGR